MASVFGETDMDDTIRARVLEQASLLRVISRNGVGIDRIDLQAAKRLGIEVTFVDATDPENIAAAIRPNTRAVYIETLANPKNDVLDYERIVDAVRSFGGEAVMTAQNT